MLTSSILGALSALVSAAMFGSGDFCGGFAARRASQFHVLFIVAFSGVIMLAMLALVWDEPLPSPNNVFWAALAGASGALGLALFYRALAAGNAAIVSPTAGVIGAALPVIVGMFTEGLAETAQLVGFAVAILGIWLTTRTESANSHDANDGLFLALVAGCAFGGFFIMIAQTDSDTFFFTLMVGKAAAFAIALTLLSLRGMKIPALNSNPIAWLSGLLDAGGDVFCLTAMRLTRLDIAVVVTNLYPAATVLLAFFIQKAKISRPQWIGVLLCLVAIGLIVY